VTVQTPWIIAVFGWVYFTLTLLAVAGMLGFQWADARRRNRRERHAPDAQVLRLPSQPSHCRVVDLSDHRPSA